MAAAVRIGGQPGRDWLDFDLGGVMSAMGSHPELDWWLYAAWFNCDVTAVWPEGVGIEEKNEERPGLALDWDTMERLASVCHQIIDGFFIGYDNRGQPILQLAVIDSTYWTVWAGTRGFSTPYALLSTTSSQTTNRHPQPLDASGT